MKIIKQGLGFLFSVALTFALLECLWLYVPQVQTAVTGAYITITDWLENFTDTDSIAEAAELLPETLGEGTLVENDDLGLLADSGITGEDYTVDTEKCPYYSFLTDTEQTVYKQICANMEALESTFIPTVSVTVSEVGEAMEAVFGDHPEYFWIETGYGYRYTDSGVCVQITLYYNSAAENLESAQAQFDAVVSEIVNAAEMLDSDYEKEKYVHDAILKIAEYDESVSDSLSQSAYSALVMGRTVCAGYARAFQYIMLKLGITTYYVTGYASSDHAWNIVGLSDGYYNVDLTWDDSVADSYTYFNIPDSVFEQTHTRTGLSTQLPACTGTEYYDSGSSEGAKEIPERFRPQEDSAQNGTQPDEQEENTLPDSAAGSDPQPDTEVQTPSLPVNQPSDMGESDFSQPQNMPSDMQQSAPSGADGQGTDESTGNGMGLGSGAR